MPPMYDDLWTAAKGMYKIEPAVADGGEVVIYAPHVTEVSYVHGKLIDEIGYHCRDYFLAQWERFKHYPGGILAHSTHVRGLGTFDAVVRPRNAAHPRHARDRHPARALRADQSRIPGSGDRQSRRLAGARRDGWSSRAPARCCIEWGSRRRGGSEHVLRARSSRAPTTCYVPGAQRARASAGVHVRHVHEDVATSCLEHVALGTVERRSDVTRLWSIRMTYKMGVVGLGVMGASLARNIESKGFPVVGYDLDTKKTQAFLDGPAKGKAIAGADKPEQLMEMLEQPRRVLMMVPAGRAGRQRHRAPAPAPRRRRHPDRRRQLALHRHRPAQRRSRGRRASASSAPACRAARRARCSARRSCRADRRRPGTRWRRSSAPSPPRPTTASRASTTWDRAAPGTT